MADILKDISHDSINRFLLREHYTPKDLYDFLLKHGKIEVDGGVISGDDTMIEKPYSKLSKTPLLRYYWSSTCYLVVLEHIRKSQLQVGGSH